MLKQRKFRFIFFKSICYMISHELARFLQAALYQMNEDAVLGDSPRPALTPFIHWSTNQRQAAMSDRKLRTMLGALAATVLATLGNAAHAGFYDSDFDPFPFNGTGFEGQAVFKLNSGCETTGVHLNNPFGGFGCTFDMEPGPGTWVKVYDYVNGVKVATANLNFNTAKFPDTKDMFGLAYAGGDITAVATHVIGGLAAIPTDPSNPNNAYFLGNWFLQFVVTPGFPAENIAYNDDHPPVVFDTNVVLYHGCVNPRTVLGVILKCNNTDPSTIAVATEVSFAPVPEPGTIALLLGGIGAGWLSRRRKAAA